MNACNKCNSTDVTHSTDVELNTYKGAEYSVDIEYSTCASCKREFLTKPQIIANEARVRDEKKIIDGLLSSEEIRSIRRHLKLSQTDAAVVFGGGQNAFSKYERSEVTQSQAMDKLLRLAVSSRYIYKNLIMLSTMENKAQVISSIDMPITIGVTTKRWTQSEFSVSTTTHEFNGPKLKLVA